MGLFLSMMACKTSNQKKVIDSLIECMSEKNIILKSKNETNHITGEENEFQVISIQKGWILVFMSDVPDEELAKNLSKKLNTPVFLFHIHNGDFWTYSLFITGELKDKHNPIPDYWKKINKKERQEWKGNPEILAEIFNIPKESIEKYLIFWDDIEDEDKKAYSKDNYPIKNEWSMIDFQRKFGIEYPDFENQSSIKLINLVFGKKDKKRIKDWLGRLINERYK